MGRICFCTELVDGVVFSPKRKLVIGMDEAIHGVTVAEAIEWEALKPDNVIEVSTNVCGPLPFG